MAKFFRRCYHLNYCVNDAEDDGSQPRPDGQFCEFHVGLLAHSNQVHGSSLEYKD
jgi:hypothetical protein